MAYNKRIIVDLDDTICITTTRDWETAKPIWPVINKMNNLYDKGWEVWVVTARGQLSCKGDFKKADKKYRVIIESWLKKHGAKYHELRFEKYLASYYIDDKSMTPKEFIDLEIREIKTGWSGAKVEKRGDRIFKTHHDSLTAAKWYNMAAPLINVPIVHSMIGQTLSLEFLEDNGHYFKIDDINDAIEKFSLYKTKNSFDQYVNRMCMYHCNILDDFHEIVPIISQHEFKKYCNAHSSFMHGDLSLENVIQTNNGLFFIDPIYSEKQWSSYLLDISKMLHSYRKYDRMFEYEIFLNGWVKKGLDKYILQVLEVTQWIRVIKYIPDEEMKKEYKEKTKLLLKKVVENKKQ